MKKALKYLLYHVRKRPVYALLFAFFIGVELSIRVRFGLFWIFSILLFILFLYQKFSREKDTIFFKLLFLLVLFIALGSLRYQIDENIYFDNIEKNYGKILDEEICIDYIKAQKVDRVEYVARSSNFGGFIFSLPLSQRFLEQGQRVALKGVLSEPFEGEDFSYKDYLKIYKINYVLKNVSYIQQDGDVCDFQIAKYMISKLKTTSCNRIDKVFAEPVASLIKGLSFGLNVSVSPKFQNDLEVSGLGHITAVSGYNMTLVLTIFISINTFFNKRGYILVLFLILLFYGFLVGFSNYSAMRALIMSFMALVALFAGRKINVIDNLVYSAFILGIINPLVYKSIGFIFSAIATLGLCTTTRIFESLFVKILKHNFSNLSANLSASVWVYPLSLYNFHTLSLHSLVLNLVLSPIISFSTLVSFFLFVVSIFSLKLLKVLWFFVFPFEVLVRAIEFGGQFTFLFIQSLRIKSLFFLLFYILLFTLVVRWYFENKFHSYTHKLKK